MLYLVAKNEHQHIEELSPLVYDLNSCQEAAKHDGLDAFYTSDGQNPEAILEKVLQASTLWNCYDTLLANC